MYDSQQPASEEDINRKLDELIGLLATSDFDSRKIEEYRNKINAAFDRENLKAYTAMDNQALTRDEMLNNLAVLLEEKPVNSRIAQEYVRKNHAKRIVLVLLGIVMVTLGFAMIIMPAPPYFEMFTIFYFNNDDGVTLMDLIALAIVLAGVYLIINSLVKHKRER
jgi:hypothetical protein